MVDNAGLSVEQLDRIYEDQIYPIVFNGTRTSVEPTVVILAGAPGAITPGVENQAKADIGQPPVDLDGRQLRHFHPDYDALADTNPALANQLSAAAVGHWEQRIRDDAIRAGNPLIVRTDLRRPDRVMDLMRDLKANGYTVDLRVVADHPTVSATANVAVAEVQHDEVALGRLPQAAVEHVPLDYHDQIVEGIPAAAEQLHMSRYNLDRMSVLTRSGQVLWEGPHGDGPRAAIEAEYRRPLTTVEHQAVTAALDFTHAAQYRRGAGLDEYQPVEQLRYRAATNTGPLQREPQPDPRRPVAVTVTGIDDQMVATVWQDSQPYSQFRIERGLGPDADQPGFRGTSPVDGDPVSGTSPYAVARQIGSQYVDPGQAVLVEGAPRDLDLQPRPRRTGLLRRPDPTRIDRKTRADFRVDREKPTRMRRPRLRPRPGPQQGPPQPG